jgi:RimJ/RimL family protein N-acetyltransferase
MVPRNAASISLAEALGFEWVGTTLDTDRFKESVSTVTSCGSTKNLGRREGGEPLA